MDKLFDAACIGTCLMDISTTGLDFETFLENEPNLADGIFYGSGGDANNQSVVLGRLGHKVSFLTGVGDDFVGDFVINEAKKSNVDTSHISIMKGVETAANNILIGDDDKRVYTISKNETSRTRLGAEHIDLDVVKNAKVVSIGSIFVHPRLDKGIEKILTSAKEAGAVTCADVCPSGEECSLESLGDAAKKIDYLFVNESEAKYLSKKEDSDDISGYFLSLGVKNVIIKLGKNGSVLRNKDISIEQEAFLVESVDTTGAGDCYAAGFISGLIRNMDLKECMQFASACSSLTVQSVGATKAIQSMEQVNEYLDGVLKSRRK